MSWRCSRASISEREIAAPPQGAIRTEGRVISGFASRWRSRLVQMVGTAAAMVTSSAAMSEAIGAAWRNRPGWTRVAPPQFRANAWGLVYATAPRHGIAR